MAEVFEFLFRGENIAFLVAGIAVLSILAFEILAMLIGGSLNLIGGHGDIDVGKPDVGGFLDWLNPGHVPVIVLLTAFMGSLSVCGYTMQWLVASMDMPLLHWMMATPIATVFALPIVRGTSAVFNRIVPQETTNAITVEDLFGFYGKMTLGVATNTVEGQAKFKDDHGVTHYLSVVTDGADVRADVGDDVVLLNRLRDDSHVFVVRKI